ncbi:hypothetical protein DW103_13610 [Parabacteroides sp. AM08-6]|nr:hypothetical protein DW103_13610 [Parabacteroides sp. AM08-6]
MPEKLVFILIFSPGLIRFSSIAFFRSMNVKRKKYVRETQKVRSMILRFMNVERKAAHFPFSERKQTPAVCLLFFRNKA